MHRLDRRTECVTASRLHFDERHFVAASHHQIDVAMSTAKTVRNDCPPVAAKPSRRDTLTKEPECLSLFRHERR
jgi:hypothetical protein